jgi:hypothetical protein
MHDTSGDNGNLMTSADKIGQEARGEDFDATDRGQEPVGPEEHSHANSRNRLGKQPHEGRVKAT